MKLDFLRDILDDEKDGAISLMTLMQNLNRKTLSEAKTDDFCSRDKEFIDRLKWLASIDESIIERVMIVRKKLLRIAQGVETPIPLVQKDADTIMETGWKGFYDTGLYMPNLIFGDLNLSEGFIYGDYICDNTIIRGDCNEIHLFVKGKYGIARRKIEGKHICKGLKVFNQRVVYSMAPVDADLSGTKEGNELDTITEDDFIVIDEPLGNKAEKTVIADVIPKAARVPRFPPPLPSRPRFRPSKPPPKPAAHQSIAHGSTRGLRRGSTIPPQKSAIKTRISMPPKIHTMKPHFKSADVRTEDLDGEWTDDK